MRLIRGRRLYGVRNLPAIAVAAALFTVMAPGESAGQTPPEPKQAPAAAPAIAIPPAEVASRAMEATDLLRTFSSQLAPRPEIEKIRKSLPEVSSLIGQESADTVNVLQGQPALATLQAQQLMWQRRQLQITTWLSRLTKRAVELRGTLDRLSRERQTWIQTRDIARAGQAPGQILQQIETVLSAIDAAQTPLQVQHDGLLELQGRVSEELARCDETISKIVEAQQRAVAGILTRQSPPIWSSDQWDQARMFLPGRISEIAAAFWADIVQYVRDPSREMPLHAGLFVLLSLVICAARRNMHRWAAGGVDTPSAATVFDRPFVAALFASLYVATRISSPTPFTAKELFTVLALAAMIPLVKPVVSPLLAPGLYAVWGLYTLDVIREVFGGAARVEQVLLLLESLAGMAVVAWLLGSQRLRHAFAQAKAASRTQALAVFARFALLYLAVGLVAGALGYMRLARIITPGTISASALALALYACVRLSGGVVAVALRVWPLRRLEMVRNHGDLIQKRAYRLLVWLAILGWAIRSLDHIGLLDPVLSLGSAILALKLERGTISVSIEDILAFGITVWAAYLLSAFIRFALQEEVYPRRGVARGLSYAYSRLVHYVILAIGFLVGLGVLGMDLSKVSVMAGAFGVGIGFGLQDVVNNFVCGLILLFERPVHVGDTIEVGGLTGEVRRIGIRASTVRTYQGADIIVPNSQFITANVTNWTLSDQLRRIDLPVGVNYGAAPQQVIELLEKAAAAHPSILKDPPPQALFMGYGDSSINFELRAWTDQFGNWTLTRSEIASAVYDAVYAAGMSFPFPQREVRVLGEPEDKKTAVLRTDGGTETPQKNSP